MSEQPSAPPPDDRELEQFLSRNSALSQAYRDAHPAERVPQTLDAAVTVWARREHQQHLGARGRWWGRAALPLGAAVSLILVVLLVNQGRESGVSARAAIQHAIAPASAPASAPAPAAPTGLAAAVPLVQANQPRPASADSFSRSSKAPKPPANSGSPAKRAEASAPPAAPTSPPPVESAPQVVAPTAEAKASVAAADRGADHLPAASPPPPAAARAVSAPAAMMAAPAPAPAPAVANGVASIAAAAQLQRCDATAEIPDAKGFPQRQSWLAAIRKLREGGDTASARRQLSCWRHVYPQSEVPADLKALLQP